MKNIQILKQHNLFPLRAAYWSSVLLLGLTLAACGGGGGSPVPEAVVSHIESDVAILEGSSANGTSDLIFTVTLDKPVVSQLELRVSTLSAIKPGFVSTPGAAKAGAACGGDVDYVHLVDNSIVFSPGSRTGQITVKVCQDTSFEPNEILYVNWSPLGGQISTLKGTILNDDVGGLNSTGTTALLGGLPAFGRDVNALTNNIADGALGFSFASVSSGACTQDKVTGLTWQKNWPGTGTAYSTVSLGTLVDNANNAVLCGKSDWRVPTTNELLSLINFGVSSGNPINADVLVPGDSMTGEYWTSETVATATDQAWVVSPGQGGAVSFMAKTPSSPPLIRLVSGESRASSCGDAADRFTILRNITGTADGTVYDSKSGLMWKQCTEGSEGAQCNLTSTVPFETNRSEAATYIFNWLKNVNENPITLGAGFGDWRLPSVKELASLVDRCNTSASIDATIFPNSKPLSYISATKNANDASLFWYVNFFDGTIAVGLPTGKYIRLVRAGQ
jgi:hypothetical protein